MKSIKNKINFYEIYFYIIAKLLYLCKIYIYGNIILPKMPKQSHY